MADLTINIPDAAVPRVVAALSKALSCDETPAAVRVAIRERMKDWVRWVERDEALKAGSDDFDDNWTDPGLS